MLWGSVNLKAIKQYENVIGASKVYALFKEFQKDVKNKFNAKPKNSEELRVIYHNLRSSSLVFGMKKFSKICERIENKIIRGDDVKMIEIDIKEAKIAFEKDILKVIAYFAKKESL